MRGSAGAISTARRPPQPSAFPRQPSRSHPPALEVFHRAFYRGRGAYLVGRMISGGSETPLAFCLRHREKTGLMLDAVLIGEGDLAILFSYTRAYFRVAAPSPYELVQWLRTLMPGKRVADLYNAIGYNRHAKTEFYRDFVRHLQQSHDCFVAAEGERGMVMLVFTLPSYDVVFKLIRDRFDLPKDSDRGDVKRRYRMVFEHDRAGRLVEAHELRASAHRAGSLRILTPRRSDPEGRRHRANRRPRRRDRARLRRAPRPAAESFLCRSG